MPEWITIALRTLLAVVVLFFMTKLLGKRQISQLSLFEYITGITIGSLAAYISLEADVGWHLGLISLVVWVGVSYAIETLQLKSKRMRDFIDGTATVVIQNGKIIERNLAKERLTLDELLEQLRTRGIFRVGDVEFAIMETSGELNVLPVAERQPLTPAEVGLSRPIRHVPQAVVMDGCILTGPLAELGLTKDWLLAKLQERGLELDQVSLAQVDENGRLYADRIDDHSESSKTN